MTYEDGYQAGEGPGNGAYRTRTECDGIPYNDAFWDEAHGVFYGHFYCPCV